MSGSRTVKVEILGDAKSLASAFGAAEKAAGGFGGAIGKVGGVVGDVAKIAGGFVIGQGLMKLPGLFSDAVSAGSNLNESLNAVNQIFGDSAQTILDWGKNNANSFGLSQRAFNDLAVPLGAGLKNAGLSMDDVTGNTIKLTERAADMASVFNTDVGTALAAIQAGLRGESDPLEQFGVGLSAAAVDAEAMAMSGKSVASELTNQEKALARVNLIMKQTDAVAGDFTDTSDGAANSARIAAAKQEELAAVIGLKLLPVQQAITAAKLKFMEVIATKVLPVVFRLASALEGPVKNALSLVRDGVLTFVQALSGNWSDNENIHGLHRVFGNLGLIIREQVIPAVQGIAAFFQDTLWPIIQSGLGVIQGLVSAFGEGGIGGALSALPGLITPHLELIGGMFLSLGQKLVDWVAPMIPPLLEKLGELALSIGTWITDTGLPLLLEKLGVWADAFGAWVADATPPMLEQLGLFLEAAGAWIADEGLPLLFEKLQVLGQALVDWIEPRIVPVLEALGALLLAVGEWIATTAAPAIGEKLLEWGNQFVAWVGPQIDPLLGELSNLLAQLGGWLVNTALPTIISNLSQWGQAFVAWVAPQIPPLLAELGNLLVQFGGWLLNTALPEITAKLAEWGAAFVAWVAPQIPPLLLEFGKLLVGVTGWMTSTALPAIILKLAEWAAAFIGWIATDVLPRLPGALADIAGAITGWIGSVDWGGMLYDAGRALVQGLINGIGSLLGSLKSKIDEITNLLVIDVPGFSPPYDAGYKQGRRFMDGLTDGMGSGLPGFRAVADQPGEILAGVGTGGTGGRGGGAGPGAGSGGTGGRPGDGTGSGGTGGRGGGGGTGSGGTGGRGGTDGDMGSGGTGGRGQPPSVIGEPATFDLPLSGHFANPQGGGGSSTGRMGRGVDAAAASMAESAAAIAGTLGGGGGGGGFTGGAMRTDNTIHRAYMVEAMQEWIALGRPGPFSEFYAMYLHAVSRAQPGTVIRTQSVGGGNGGFAMLSEAIRSAIRDGMRDVQNGTRMSTGLVGS